MASTWPGPLPCVVASSAYVTIATFTFDTRWPRQGVPGQVLVKVFPENISRRNLKEGEIGILRLLWPCNYGGSFGNLLNSFHLALIQLISLSALKHYLFSWRNQFPFSFRSASGHKMKFNYLPLKCFYAWLIAIPQQHKIKNLCKLLTTLLCWFFFSFGLFFVVVAGVSSGTGQEIIIFTRNPLRRPGT